MIRPSSQNTVPTESTQRRVARRAALSLVGFSSLTALALAAWFSRAAQPWGAASTLAILSVVFGLLASVAVWRAPTRTSAIGGVVVLVASALRAGMPSDWTASSVALLVITAAFLPPVVHAAIVLPSRA